MLKAAAYAVLVSSWVPICVAMYSHVVLLYSGYTFASLLGLSTPESTLYHDVHHSGNKGNYGGSPFLDQLYGTHDPAWLKLQTQARAVKAGSKAKKSKKKNQD